MKITKNRIITYLSVAVILLALISVANLLTFKRQVNKEIVTQNIYSAPKVDTNIDTSYLYKSFVCDGGKIFKTSAAQVENSPGPDAIYIPETITSLAVTVPGIKDPLYLSNDTTRSDGSFSQYRSKDGAAVFQIKSPGLKASLTVNGNQRFTNCTQIR
jgi:hypothetical protein